MAGWSRREFLASAALAPVASAMRSAAAQERVVRVATWGGSWRDSLNNAVGARLAAKGIKIEYVLGNPDDNIAKLIAARRQGQTAFDVLEFTPAQRTALAQAGVLEPLDYAQIPNAKTIPDWAREERFVCGQYTGDGIVYNAKLLGEAGAKPPTRYGDLRDPKLRGKVAFPDIQNGAHWSATTALAREGGGGESNMAPAIDLVNEIAPAYFFSSSTDLATKFGAGEIWVAPWQSGWGVRLRKAGQPVDVTYAAIGDRRGALWPLAQGLIKGSPNAQAAHAFMDEFLAPEPQLAHGNATGSLPINAEARKKMGDDPMQGSMLLLTDAQLDHAFRIDWTNFDQRRWRETWNRALKR
jgi:putative spermidine/putrescine transport system substrate-binding protein